MEAVRNHIQHRGFPIGSLTLSNEWQAEGNVQRSRICSRVVAELDIPGMQANPKFKRVVLKELEEVGPPCDVSNFLRQYVEQLSSVHEALRGLCAEADTWQEVVREWLERYGSLSGGALIGTVAVMEDAGAWLDTFPVFEEPAKRLKEILRRNVLHQNLSRRFISN